MGFQTPYPNDSTEQTVDVASGTTTAVALNSTIIKHENPSVEEGYATLAVRLTGNASDSVKIYCALYYGETVGYSHDLTGATPGFLLEDKDGATSFAPSSDGYPLRIFSLNRQKFWTLNQGMKFTAIKTGTNGALEILWRSLYR